MKSNFRANRYLAHATVANKTTGLIRKLGIPTNYGYDYVWADEIIYCEADGSYTNLCLVDGFTILSSKNIGEFEAMLSAYNYFFRAHKSYIINLLHVSKYKKEDGGYVEMDNGKGIIISKRKKAGFLRLFLDR